MTAEWKPTTEEIKNTMCRNVPDRDCDDCKYVCCSETKLNEFRQVAIAAQTKLLEYLYKLLQDGNWISATSIQQMLKEELK